MTYDPARHLVHHDRPAAVRYDSCAREFAHLHAEHGSAGAKGNQFFERIRDLPSLRCCALHDPHRMRTGDDPSVHECEGKCCDGSSRGDGSALWALPGPNDVTSWLSNFWSRKVPYESLERGPRFRNNVALRRNLPSAKSRR